VCSVHACYGTCMHTAKRPPLHAGSYPLMPVLMVVAFFGMARPEKDEFMVGASGGVCVWRLRRKLRATRAQCLSRAS